MLQKVIDIVKEASALMVSDHFTVMQKDGLANLVTSSDLAVQHFLTERLAALLPGCGFLCEEEDFRDLEEEYVWIIDPIHVSDRPLADGLFCTAMSTYRKEYAKSCSEIIYDIYMQCNDLRRWGSAAVELCLLASGIVELYFEMRLQPWDYAAAMLILHEAGGCIAGWNGGAPSLTNQRSSGMRKCSFTQKSLHS